MVLLPTSLAAVTLEQGPFDASGVTIDRFSGNLVVALGTSDTIALTLEAPQDVIDRATFEVEGDRLMIRDVRTQGNQSVVVTGDVNAISGDGGKAQVVIGGDGKPVEPTELHMTVPAGTELSLKNFTGSGQIPDLRAPFSLDAKSASIRAGELGPSELSINGSGSVDVAGVQGDLLLSIKGSGNIMVADGKVGALRVFLQGSGTIRFAGAAETAVVRGQGAGRIEIAKVASPAEVDVKGGIKVDVGQP